MDVLLLRAGALGDLLLLRPTIAALRASGHRVQLLAPPAAGGVLVGPDAVDTLLASDGPELASALAHGFADGPLARALRAAGAVVAYTRSAALVEALRPVARRLFVHDPAPPPAGPHAAVWLARAVLPLVGEAALAAASTLRASPLGFTDAERRQAEARARGLPRSFVAVHAGSGSPSKNWPLERFLEAAARLADGSPWLFVAGPAEAALAAPAGAIVARDWPLRTLGAALSRTGLFLGNDSGVTHLAAAAGAPTLALFGPTDPSLWSPTGRSSTALRAADGSLSGLGVDDVVAAALRLRSAASGPPSAR